MKRTLATMLLAALCVTGIEAQDLRFGVKGGLNISKESQNESVAEYISTDLSFRAGFHVGGVVNYSLGRQWELEADLLYSMQGYKDKINVEAEQRLSKENYTVTSHYLNLPLAVKFFPVDGFYIEAGPQFGYLLSKKAKLDDWEGDDMYSSDNTKKFDFGLFGGVGYRFSNGVFVEGRYIHGLTDTSKLYDGGKNRNIQLSLGYLF